MIGLLWLIIVVLLVLWIVGLAVNWGAFAWILLIAALVILAVAMVTGPARGRWR